MAIDAKIVNQAINDYISDVKNAMPIDHVFLFGSYANGTANDDSDIDICFFSYDFESKKSVDILYQLCRLTRKYNRIIDNKIIDIEPHAFPTSELQNDNPFVKEILRTGKEIY
jgi:predicted nucleotidyltransferase